MSKYVHALFAGFFIVLLSTLFACGSTTSTTTSSTPVATGPQSIYLVNGNISISAETRTNYAFTVSATMKNVSVVGKFSTFGGAPNSIEVYIMDDATYVKWQKGGTVHILFDSQSLSSGDIDQAITTPGKYYLIFANYHPASLSPAQQVSTSIELKWVN